MCGEAVQFDLKNQEILYVESESHGLFRSDDANAPRQALKKRNVGLVWSFQSPSGDGPSCGMIAVSSDWRDGEIWHFVSVDGVYVSTDSGKTLKKVL